MLNTDYRLPIVGSKAPTVFDPVEHFACPLSWPSMKDVESPQDDIAAQIRAQGYACDQPQSATRDVQASKPDEAVWLLRCEGASYRIRLIPNMAAQVERIDQ